MVRIDCHPIKLFMFHTFYLNSSGGNVKCIKQRPKRGNKNIQKGRKQKLVKNGELGLERITPRKDKSKEDDSDGSQLLLSPSLKYALATTIANKYIDPKTKRKYQAYTAFQILVQPGSYKIGPPSQPGIAKPIDPHLDHDTAEWVTKERGATVLCALLIRLETL
uniref:Uncharacterized protein n=1 Tax=Timema douglasi TaxID=61478 RepID=A0A7R8VDX5_TIMDO|nr:unnamed protein product [Timema douglasi]